MFLVDSHCHLDALNYEKLHVNLDAVLESARNCDIKHLLAVATTLSGYLNLKTLVGDRDNISLSCGIHPLNIDEGVDFVELRRLAADSRVIALGETGLDYFYLRDNSNKQDSITLQQRVFREHIRISRDLSKPIIVHTRDAKADTLAILNEEGANECGGVLHCFTEDKPMAQKLLDLGFYISFSGIVTFRNADILRDVARYVPLDRILLETDSPYLAPAPHRGKENQPAYLKDIAEYMAQLKGISLSTLAQATTDNFCHLFQLTTINSTS